MISLFPFVKNCIENLGNFDHGADVMTTVQKEAIISVTAILCKKFNLPVNTHTFGTVLRVYEEHNGWLKISGSQSHWVSGRFTQYVQRATVTANTLNIRWGQGTHFDRAGSITKNEEVFIFEEKDGWARISPNDLWVFKRYLN